MVNHEKLVHSAGCEYLAWRPIFAGAIAALGFSFLLNLFAVAIGLTAYTTTSEGVEALVFGGLLGTGLGIIVSMFAAGWLTGYLAKPYCHTRHLGMLYGFLAWCIALLIAVSLTEHIQHYLAFYSHFLSGSTDMVQISNTPVNNTTIAVSKQVMSGIVVSHYIVFILFFLGAFSSSLGGHCGMRYACEKEIC